MKRFSAIFLSLAMVFTLIPTAFAYQPSVEVKAATSSPETAIATGFTVATYGDGGAVIDDKGALWVWGDIEDDQSEDTSTQQSMIPQKMMEDVISISGDGYNMAAIKKDHTLWVWGNNFGGSLGTGSSAETILTPQKVMDDVAFVSIDSGVVAAIKMDKTLWCWGYNYCGAVGNGGKGNAIAPNGESVQTTPVKIMDDVVMVDTCFFTTAAIKSDGSLWMWGDNEWSQLGNGKRANDLRKFELGLGNVVFHTDYYPMQTVPIKVMDDVASVSTYMSYTMAVKKDGSLWGWGSNDGQLGTGMLIGPDNPAIIEYPTKVHVIDGISYVEAGLSESPLVIKKDGSLWTWGKPGYQYAKVQSEDTRTPIKLMDDVVEVCTDLTHSFAVKKDGSLWAFDSNEYGQMDTGTAEEIATITRIPGFTVQIPADIVPGTIVIPDGNAQQSTTTPAAPSSGNNTPSGGTSGTPSGSGSGSAPATPANPPASTSAPADSGTSDFAEEVLRLVNEERAKEGISPLKMPDKLKKTAQIRAEELPDTFAHTRPDGRTCFTALAENGVSYSTAGENIAAGYSTPAAVVEGWMNSPGHRANILNKNFGNIGIGMTSSGGARYWCQMFTN